MDKAAQKSIEWQKANSPMAIGGDAFAGMVDAYNVNPAFVAGYKEAKKDVLEKIEKQVNLRMPDNPEGDEYDEGQRVAFRSVLELLKEMED